MAFRSSKRPQPQNILDMDDCPAVNTESTELNDMLARASEAPLIDMGDDSDFEESASQCDSGVHQSVSSVFGVDDLLGTLPDISQSISGAPSDVASVVSSRAGSVATSSRSGPIDFTPAELKAETQMVRLVHMTLQQHGRLGTDALFQKINEKLLEQYDPVEHEALTAASKLHAFLEMRHFLFEKTFNTYRNRGFGYRNSFCEAISVTFVCDDRVALAKVAQILINNSKPLTPEHEWNDLWSFSVRSQQEARDFLLGYPTLFSIEGNYVTLRPEAREVPSLWRKECLFPYPASGKVDKYSKGKVTVYWDKSRTFALTGYVVASVPRYAKIEIRSGEYQGRSVYVLGNLVGFIDCNVNSVIPNGVWAECFAHFTLRAANDFSAIHVRALAEKELEKRSIWNGLTNNGKMVVRKATKTVVAPVHSQYLEDFFKASSNESKKSRRQRRRVLTSDQQRMLDMLTETEWTRIGDVDRCLAGGVKTMEQLSMELLGRDKPFKLFAHLCDFIATRPHLYGFESSPEDKIDDFRVFARDTAARKIAIAFMEIVQDTRPFGITKEQFRARVVADESGTELDEHMKKAGAFDALFDILSSVFRLHMEGSEVYYTLSGALLVEEDIFIPNVFL